MKFWRRLIEYYRFHRRDGEISRWRAFVEGWRQASVEKLFPLHHIRLAPVLFDQPPDLIPALAGPFTEWWDELDSDLAAARLFIEMVCAFVGVVPVPKLIEA